MRILEDDRYCFACGSENPHGLKLTFQKGPDGSTIAGFTPRREHQGYTGVIHGGIITTALDEVMAHAAISLKGEFYITAEITVRFIEPLFIGEETTATAKLLKSGGRLIPAEAELKRIKDGKVIAKASGKLLRQAGGWQGGPPDSWKKD